jgi:hypothetical protein
MLANTTHLQIRNETGVGTTFRNSSTAPVNFTVLTTIKSSDLLQVFHVIRDWSLFPRLWSLGLSFSAYDAL